MKVILTYHKEFEFEIDKDGRPIEPKCPTCSGNVRRYKCLFELDPSQCPRHDLLRAYGIALKRFKKAIGEI